MVNYPKENSLEEVMYNGVVKRHFGWTMSFLQHPMYLLVDEDRGDPVVGERVEPWGAPNTDVYIERVRRNLDSLERHERLRLNYEFSAVELQELCDKYPDVHEQMKRLYKARKLDFVNGTYSQPHLQDYDSEITWRQFEQGLKVYHDYFGADIRVYAMQETAIHQQITQVLKKLGYSFMNVPCFPWAMELKEGTMELHGQFRGLDTMRDEDFVDGVSLDGTTLPVYVKGVDPQEVHLELDIPKEEISKDLYSGPTCFTFTPDLIEISDELYEKTDAAFRFALLSDALAERYGEVTPRAKAMFYTYWSYAEGTWAEAFIRANKAAEERLLILETMAARARSLGHDTAEYDACVNEGFRKVLKYQHHDISWTEVTDLRRKAVNYMKEVLEGADRKIEKLSAVLCGQGSKPALVNTFGGDISVGLVTDDPARIPAGSPAQKLGDTYISQMDVQGGSIQAYEPASALPEEAVKINTRYLQTDYATFILSETGLFEKIVTKGGRNVCKAGEYLGGELRAMMDDNEYYSNRDFASEVYDGPCAYVILRKGMLKQLPIQERYIIFKHRNEVKVSLTLEGNGCKVGCFWLDETKLNVYYPMCGKETYYDVPFGYIPARENRVLFAPNWVSCGGLTYVNKGTVKHWKRNNVLANVLLWGGDSFTNRMHTGWEALHQYSVVLENTETVEYSLLIDEETAPSAVVHEVEKTKFRPAALVGGSEELFRQDDMDLAVTAIYARDGKVFERGYKLPGEAESDLRDFEIYTREI